jgi:3-phenylpropionate/trans-cinnamate dioxygenase ferredoxin component
MTISFVARHRIGAVSDFTPSTATRVRVVVDSTRAPGEGDVVVSVVRIGDDFYAIDDRCTHADVSLSDGTVWPDECQLECPKHGSAFSLRTGEPQSFPATKAVVVHQVECVDDAVYLVVSSEAAPLR